MSRAKAPDGARSFIRTGGQWVRGRCLAPEPCHEIYGARVCCAHYRHGYYQGGTVEPGRFTGKLAPMPRVSFPTLDTVTAAPDYSSPTAIMMRAREAGTGNLPIRGEQLGRGFLAALRATGDDWRRPVDFPNRPEVGSTFDWAAAAHDVLRALDWRAA